MWADQLKKMTAAPSTYTEVHALEHVQVHERCMPDIINKQSKNV